MTAGMPGMGLGGLFFIISALLMPVFELTRTIQGKSSIARWRCVGVQFGMAMGIILATTSALWIFEIVARRTLAHAVGVSPAKTVHTAANFLPVAPVVGTLFLLVFLLFIVEALQWLVRRPRMVGGPGEPRKQHKDI